MTADEQVISTFYTAFQNKDFVTMQRCYSDNAIFNDEVFKNLDARHVRAMWEMLIKSGKDLSLTFCNINGTTTPATANWVATYTFSKTQRRVVNHIKAEFTIENGKIVAHTDRFNFYKWARQALGLSGYLLGWTNFLKRKVQQSAKDNLTAFMNKTSKS